MTPYYCPEVTPYDPRKEYEVAWRPPSPGYSTATNGFVDARARHLRRTKQRKLCKTMKRLLETTIRETKAMNPQEDEDEEAEDTNPLKSLAMLAATINKADRRGRRIKKRQLLLPGR